MPRATSAPSLPPPRIPSAFNQPPAAASAARGLAALALSCWLLFPCAAPAETVSGRARAVDGDTLQVGSRRVRLRAMDAPELAQTCGGAPCGRAAQARLARLVAGGVACEGTRADRYGRLVAVCRARGEDVAEVLVREGFAVAYRRYGRMYVGAEEAARREGRGIWATGFDMPEDWRRARREARQHTR